MSPVRIESCKRQNQAFTIIVASAVCSSMSRYKPFCIASHNLQRKVRPSAASKAPTRALCWSAPAMTATPNKARKNAMNVRMMIQIFIGMFSSQKGQRKQR
jgi:hypothetical protein